MTFFAISDTDANARFNKFFEVDPFPDIRPALLNSSDIRSYVGATGMIYPFVENEEKFKTASYEVNLLGKCVYWDDKGEKVVKLVKENDEFILRKNSIAFVTLQPMFRLPRYIALRFNLKITHVYRGILLGTGPLVDPGFCNYLSIPLHNLTTNDYVFKGGEGLIWMEFTKLSYPAKSSAVTPTPQEWVGKIAEFPVRKNKLNDVEDYIRKGEPHRPVRSSIPEVFRNAEEAANDAKKEVDNVRLKLNLAAFAGVLIFVATTIVAVIFGVSPIISLVHDINNTATTTKELLFAAKQQLAQDEERQDQLRSQIERLELELKNTKTSGASRKR